MKNIFDLIVYFWIWSMVVLCGGAFVGAIASILIGCNKKK